jgi:hypothetical protein
MYVSLPTLAYHGGIMNTLFKLKQIATQDNILGYEWIEVLAIYPFQLAQMNEVSGRADVRCTAVCRTECGVSFICMEDLETVCTDPQCYELEARGRGEPGGGVQSRRIHPEFQDDVGADEEHEADLLPSRGDPLEHAKGFPPDPKTYYAAEWKGWRDFLGVRPDSPICDDCGNHPCECPPETTPRT